VISRGNFTLPFSISCPHASSTLACLSTPVFNIKKLNFAHRAHLCVAYDSQDKQRLFTISRLDCAVQTPCKCSCSALVFFNIPCGVIRLKVIWGYIIRSIENLKQKESPVPSYHADRI
jgi:hypothetical protein